MLWLILITFAIIAFIFWMGRDNGEDDEEPPF